MSRITYYVSNIELDTKESTVNKIFRKLRPCREPRRRKTITSILKKLNPVHGFFLVFFFLGFFFFLAFVRAAPVAYAGSQARGRIGAVAASLGHSHSNSGSKPHL